jgi:hypothetical protein
LTLRDFLVEDPRGDMWEVWIQLFGGEEPPWTEQSVFPLTTIEMWGKPADKKGRKSECGGVPFYPITSELTITATEP